MKAVKAKKGFVMYSRNKNNPLEKTTKKEPLLFHSFRRENSHENSSVSATIFQTLKLSLNL